MGKRNTFLVAVGIVMALLLEFFVIRSYYLKQATEKTPLGFASSGGAFNLIDTTTARTTTTLSTNAQIVLDKNPNRIYAAIQNDSATDVYIHLRSFTDQTAASTTVTRNNGIRLPANGGLFEILPENMYIGQVWVASSTVAGLTLLVTER